MSSSTSAAATSYWCYRCSRFVRVHHRDAVSCPDCDGGFLEEIDTPPSASDHRRRRFPSHVPALTADEPARPSRRSEFAHRRRGRASAGDRSPFNPVIVLRGPSDGGGGGGGIERDPPTSSFELYYDDGAGSGLRPLPSSVSDFLMGSGFDRLLGQLAQIETNGLGGVRSCEHPPASKSAIESMPTIEIATCHIGMDSHCAVCKDPFELGTEAREMPCKHIFHQDCILPWLSIRNSCPVCRHELPTDVRRRGRSGSESENEGRVAAATPSEEDSVGLTIWRLPGGGFAVGRFAGGRRPGERELPAVYTEMDGGFNSGGAPRRISWSSRGSRSRERGGVGRAFRNFMGLFGCFGGSSASTSRSVSVSASAPASSSSSRRHWRAPMLTSRSSRRHSSSWALEDGSGNSIARW